MMNNFNDEFVEEVKINFNDLELYGEIGRGAFGTVLNGMWEENVVAVKVIDMSSGVKEYQDEVQQLSNVRHENIIQLFGTSMHKNKVYIVMEFADCGSLYNVLHPSREEDTIDYNLGHVVRWCLQCAKAVEYLHSLQPKVIHRDLKPPNMLLTEYGKVIKICDFGTATQIKTEMTSNKGSAAWMAPEVFEGKRYSEKCDVYSFGIVLWEMLSRKKPFDEIGPPAFRILWAVYNGTRPPPLKGIPETLMNLMERCWAKDQSKRPSFSEIVKYFSLIDNLVDGAEIPIFYDDVTDEYNPPEGECDSVKLHPIVPVTPHDFTNVFSTEEFSFGTPQYQRYPTVISAEQYYPLYNTDKQHDSSTQMSPVSFKSGSSPHSSILYNRSPIFDVVSSSEFGGDPSASGVNVNPIHVDWSVVPEHLMPVKPIPSVSVSVKLYDNYNEALKKYVDLQLKIKDLKVQKENLEDQIKEVNKSQENNAFYLERYVKLANDKAELLEHHQTIKTILENDEKQCRLNMSRSRSHTP